MHDGRKETNWNYKIKNSNLCAHGGGAVSGPAWQKECHMFKPSNTKKKTHLNKNI